jgi:hypothetical protein
LGLARRGEEMRWRSGALGGDAGGEVPPAAGDEVSFHYCCVRGDVHHRSIREKRREENRYIIDRSIFRDVYFLFSSIDPPLSRFIIIMI